MNLPLNTINLSDNIEFIKKLPNDSIDAIITDSPYGLGKEPNPIKVIPAWIENGFYEIKGKGFMDKTWDSFVPQPALWKECYRVLKPGGYLLSFFGTRTYDWGTIAIRFSGFEIRDCIQWIYGSGFPKSKACLKPANEPICVARKPGPLQFLNIDECRIETDWSIDKNFRQNGRTGNVPDTFFKGKVSTNTYHNNPSGRWPGNVILDSESASILDEQSGFSGGDKRIKRVSKKAKGTKGIYGNYNSIVDTPSYNDFGGASRFFYVAKPSQSERSGMKHPTIKPVKLMMQLVKLYCPDGGICLDPHSGSGATLEACLETNRNYIGVDNDIESVEESNNRIKRWKLKQSNQSTLF